MELFGLTWFREGVYTSYTLEFRFRTVIPFGDDLGEYGEKQNDYRAELRVRWYF